MFKYLLGTHHGQDPITTPAHAQNFHIFKMLVPKLQPNISSSEDISQTSTERLYSVNEIPETVPFSSSETLKYIKLQSQHKSVSGSCDLIKW